MVDYCNTCAFDYLYGAFPIFFTFYELLIGRLHIVSERFLCTTRLSSFARRLSSSPAVLCRLRTIFWVKVGFCMSSIGGIILIPYIAIARLTPCTAHLVDVKNVLLRYKLEECLFEMASACCSAGQKISTFSIGSFLLSELKAFSASISKMASISGFSSSFLKLWIAYSIPHFWSQQSS